MNKVYKLYSNEDSHHAYFINGVRHEFQDDWEVVEHLLGGEAHTIHINPPDYFSLSTDEADIIDNCYEIGTLDELFDLLSDYPFLKGEVY